MEKFFEILKYFFERLSSKPIIGGLEVSDSALRFVAIKNNKVVSTSAVKIPPGVLKEGRVESPDQFSQILKNLHENIMPGKPNQVIQIVVSLPSNLVYTQSFIVPNIGKEQLEETATLNLETISPTSLDKTYANWQLIKETVDRYELLGAFSEKAVIDQYKNLLEIAKFNPAVFEFPALALGRLIKRINGAENQPVLVLWISGDGLNLFSFMEGSLYFDYFRSWQSIRGEAREILKSVFESAVTEELQRFVNFTQSRFKEGFKDIYIIAPGLEAEIKNLLESRLGLSGTPFVLSSFTLSPIWYAALGSAIRGTWERNEDIFINLNPESSAKLILEERVLSFIHLWRNIFAGVLVAMLLILGTSAAYLVNLSKSASGRLASLTTDSREKELDLLLEQVRGFNVLVTGVKNARNQNNFSYQFFTDIRGLATKNQVTLNTIEIVSIDEPINIVAHAADSETVIKFKNALVADQKFFDIDLPLSKLTLLEDNSVSFNLSFRLRK